MGMNFFEQELRKIVDPVYPNATYVGRFCFVPLSENNRARISFEMSSPAFEYYDMLQVKIVGKNDGVLDCVSFRFLDLFEVMQTDYKTIREYGKHISRRYDSAGFEWFVYKPTEAEYAILTNAVQSSTELFQEQTQEQTMTVQQDMMM